ncbi:MAG TPA: NADH-quinone oxidoreductase subunit J [Gammaproteobacteria bacterium]|jgi:NADH-quinone oxidoreductase subunit J|nr:NADH-quinone oxidoreductase subunit J [Gammaproteobacteria bacterium]|tara:strand:+ start:2277 stop:2897 length:621 start_codon:yes stop_codon:yes gene_type:complete
MNFLQFSFYLFSAILIVAASLVVTVRNPVKAALYLVLVFFSAACIWLTLEAEFLAIVLVLVYVGAVMVLFLFVVMMLDIDVARLREGFTQYLPAGLVIAGVMVAELSVVMLSRRFGLDAIPRPVARGVDYSNTRELGLVLYTDYVYAFEIAALILLVAIIAAISLTFRRRGGTKVQVIAEQLRVTKADRLRIVKMSSEITDGEKSQ